ncbi:MAG: ATP-binding protein [Planctomycetaceae bacterium]
MLIEFRVENHRSLRDEQALTMEAANLGDKDDPCPRKVDGHKKKLLPVAALYGANASGKSNVLDALAFMSNSVVYSQRGWYLDDRIPRKPFAWGGKRGEQSMFEAEFLIEGTRYLYGFSLSDKRVEEEWLKVWPSERSKKKEETWFEREDDKFKFDGSLEGPNELIKDVTREDALFLSAAAEHAHKKLKPIYKWFSNIVNFNIPDRELYHYHSPLRFTHSKLISPDGDEYTHFPKRDVVEPDLDRIREMIKATDTGIVDLRLETYETHSSEGTWKTQEFCFQHQANDENSWLELKDESAGTKTLFRMAPSIFRALDSGSVLLVDELESSLHPALGLKIVELFNSPETNPNNAQLLFTTHDTNLLGTTLGEPPLRRDQVWFAEKDKEGASKIYPLTDFKPRKVENLERGYLQGRYGAIPYLGDIAKIGE